MKLIKKDKKVLIGLVNMILKHNTELLKACVTKQQVFDTGILLTFVGAGEVVCSTNTALIQATLNKDIEFINNIYSLDIELLEKYIKMCMSNKELILDDEYIDVLKASLSYLKERENEDRV